MQLARLSAVLTLLLKIPPNRGDLQIDAHPTVTDDAFSKFIVLLFHPHVNIKVVKSVSIVIAVQPLLNIRPLCGLCVEIIKFLVKL